MIIEMIPAQIGECGDRYRNAFAAILRQAVARCFKDCVGHTFARQARHIRQKGNNIRGGQPGLRLIGSRGYTKRSDGRGVMSGHPPQLPRQLGSRRLAICARHRGDMLRERPEIFRCQLRE